MTQAISSETNLLINCLSFMRLLKGQACESKRQHQRCNYDLQTWHIVHHPVETDMAKVIRHRSPVQMG